MASPDFIIAGASRSGTTTMHEVLSRHTQIYMPPEKELQFFWREELYGKGREWYEDHFKLDGPTKVTGEVSPPYFYKGITLDAKNQYRWDVDDDVPIRIAQMYPEIKLIFTLRSPVTRAYSQYRKNRWQGKEEADSFQEAIRLELEGIRQPEDHPNCWLYRNSYAKHMERWLSLFQRTQVLVLIFEEWVTDPAKAVRSIESFLGIEYETIADEGVPVKNRGRSIRSPLMTWLLEMDWPLLRTAGRLLATERGYPPIPTETRGLLEEFFSSEIRQLESILEISCQTWNIG